MTENLLQKLEEKIMLSLSEIEDLRRRLDRSQDELANLRTEKENFEKKVESRLKDLIVLFETVSLEQVPASNLTTLKPMLVQEGRN